jgi:RND family efflux transporter MFP subunit
MKKLNAYFLILISLSILTGCGKEEAVSQGETATSEINNQETTETAQSEGLNNTNAKVKVITVKKEAIQDSITYVGTIKATSEINIIARAEGIAREIFFKEGETIKKDDTIIDISSPDGKNTSQINQELAKINAETTKNIYDQTIEKTKQSVLSAELNLSNAKQNLSDALEQVSITKNQNELIIKSSEIQLVNTRRSLERLNNTISISRKQLGINDETLIESTNIALDNIYHSLELVLFSTLRSALITLNTQNNLPSGLSRLDKDLEDLQDDLDDIRRNDLQDLTDLTDDLSDFTFDLLEYINDKDVIDLIPTLYPTLRATIEGVDSQLNGIRTGLVTSQNTLEALATNSTLQETNLDNQTASITDQIRLQENSVESAKTQSALAIHSLNSTINTIRNNIEAAEIGLNLAEIAAKMEIEQIKAQYESSLLQQEQANLQSEHLKIKSNIEGVISNLLVEVGQLISPGTPVAKIFQKNKREVEIYIDPKDLGKIPIGSNAKILFRDDNTQYTGEITDILPTADANTHLVTATINLKTFPEIIIPNSIVKVEVELSIEGDHIYIPLKSVLVREEGNYVFLLEDGKTKKVLIENGKILGSSIEVLSGLNIGETLIIDGHRTLDEGVNVEIIID